MSINRCRGQPARERGIDWPGGRSAAADGNPEGGMRRVPLRGSRAEKSEVNLCDGNRGLGTSNAFRKRHPGRQSAKETEDKGVTMYDLEETFTHTLDSVLESIDVYGEDELLDDDDLSLLHDEDDNCDDGDEI
jgi:hypothetical protein